MTRQRNIGFPSAGEVFQALSKRNRPISRARDVTMTPAPSKGPHLLGPAYPPAAVRAGTVGKLSETNDFLFFSWLIVRVSKPVYSPFVTYLLTLYGGYRDHRKRSVLKKRIRLCPLANGKKNEQAGVVKRRAKVREQVK